MSTGKRIAKRSIVGTRVSVPVNGIPVQGQSLWLPAVIHSTRVLGLETSYCVFFTVNDPDLRNILPSRKEYRAEQIIGPGFQPVTSIRRFAAGQKVFITFKGREVAGTVSHHNPAIDEVILTIDMTKNKDSNSLLESTAGSCVQVRRRIEDIRLLESRKSARLVDSDQDYSRLLEPQNNSPAAAQLTESVQQQTVACNNRSISSSVTASGHSSSPYDVQQSLPQVTASQ